MNIKADKIEQLIQISNRNLDLIFNGVVGSNGSDKSTDITPIDFHPMQKNDAAGFGKLFDESFILIYIYEYLYLCL